MKKILIPFIAMLGAVLVCSNSPVLVLAGLSFWLGAALLASAGSGAKLQPALYAFPTNCNGRLIEVSPSTGCTLSKATIRPWTTDDLEDMALKEIGYDMEYARLQEARLAGYKESGLMELVNSKVANIKNLVQRRPFKGNKSIVFPWIQMIQRRNININYWRVTAGAPNTNAGSNGVHAGAWDLTIANQAGAFATNLPNIKNYFLPGRVLYVDYASTGDNVAHHLQYKILAAVGIGDGSTCKVTVEPNVSNNGWAALSAPEKLVFQIGGVNGGAAVAGTGCYIGPNSVSDYESYKEQDTAINNSNVLHFATQTSRIKWDYTDEWLKIMKNAYMGTFFKKYWQLDEAEQRRQHQAIFDRTLLNAVFFGQKESELQDPLDETKWRQLPTAVDPANSNCIMEYKTRAEGVQTQLMNCGRFVDRAASTISLDNLFQNHYLLMRAREADTNADVNETDWMTDYETAGFFEVLMMTFYKTYYGNTTVVQIKAGDVLNPEVNALMEFKQYPVPMEFGGGYINVYHHKFFADRLRAFGSANVHRFFMAIDWSDFMFGVIATNQRTTQTNEQDEIYRYTISVNKLHCMHQSITWTAILQDPNRHLMYRNFTGFDDDINP